MARTGVAWHVIPDDLGQIDRRLQNWGKWLRPGRGGRDTSPMFRWARASDVWDGSPVRESIDVQDAIAVERAVAQLPALQRIALRWFYVWQGSPHRQARELGIKPQDLQQAVWSGMRSVSICRR